MWNILTVPRMWYLNCPRQCGIFLLFLQCGILTVPQQYGIFLLFLEYGILTVNDNVECSYCADSVVF